MSPKLKIARIAGALYLINILTGVFSLIYVPSQISLRGDPATVIANILASESLFRIGIVVGLVGFTVWLLLPLVLYRLLESVDKTASVVMVLFAVIFVPIDFVAFSERLSALSMAHRLLDHALLTPEQLYPFIRLALDNSNNAMLVSTIFWGLWLLPFGYLVFKSGFLPRILGVALMLGCAGYLISFCAEVLFPEATLPDFIMWPAAFGEFGVALWLLFARVRFASAQT